MTSFLAQSCMPFGSVMPQTASYAGTIWRDNQHQAFNQALQGQQVFTNRQQQIQAAYSGAQQFTNQQGVTYSSPLVIQAGQMQHTNMQPLARMQMEQYQLQKAMEWELKKAEHIEILKAQHQMDMERIEAMRNRLNASTMMACTGGGISMCTGGPATTTAVYGLAVNRPDGYIQKTFEDDEAWTDTDKARKYQHIEEYKLERQKAKIAASNNASVSARRDARQSQAKEAQEKERPYPLTLKNSPLFGYMRWRFDWPWERAWHRWKISFAHSWRKTA